MTEKWMQILYQLLAAVVASAWAFCVTFLILQVLGAFPCLRLKLTEQEEILGSDWVALGELAGKNFTHKIKIIRINWYKNIFLIFFFRFQRSWGTQQRNFEKFREALETQHETTKRIELGDIENVLCEDATESDDPSRFEWE